MEIIKAAPGHFDRVKDIKLMAKASERKHNKSLKPLSELREKYLSYLKTDLAAKDRAVFIATDRGKTVGIVTGRIYKTLSIRAFPKKGHISNLFIMPRHRKKGVATKLIKALLDWFRDNEITDVRLGVHARNDRALAMFKKMKFRECVVEMKMSLRPRQTASGRR